MSFGIFDFGVKPFRYNTAKHPGPQGFRYRPVVRRDHDAFTCNPFRDKINGAILDPLITHFLESYRDFIEDYLVCCMSATNDVCVILVGPEKTKRYFFELRL